MFAWMAWFIDPGQNCVGLIQLKNPWHLSYQREQQLSTHTCCAAEVVCRRP